MTQEPHVSPSQQTTYIFGCARQWAFVQIAGFAKGSSPYADRGKQCHSVLENWTNHAIPPDLSTKIGRIVYPALRHIPAPRTPGVISERNILWTSPRGNLFNFLKDLEWPEQARIWDYKTTSNLTYAKTTEDLENTDPQGVTYAAHRFLVSPTLQQIRADWLYLHANEPFGCHPTVALHKRQHCLAQFDLLDKIATTMLRHRHLKTHPMAFPPSPQHCEAYGTSCNFKSLCNLSPLERLVSRMTQTNGPEVSNFLAAIKRNAEGQVGPEPGTQANVTISAPPVQLPAVPAVQLPPVQQAAFGVPAPVPAASPAPAPVPAPQPSVALPWLATAPAISAPPIASPPATATTPEALAVSIAESAATHAATQKRKRRTKAEMAALRVEAQATGQPQPVEIQGEEDEEEPEDTTDRYSSRPSAEVPTGPVANDLRKPSSTIERSSSYFWDVALAMSQNPGFCGLDSVEFASKVRARTIALVAEAGEE